MTEYENQLATLRMEVMRLKNYECYSKELPYPDVQTEVGNDMKVTVKANSPKKKMKDLKK